jgi:hypothetical protein
VNDSFSIVFALPLLFLSLYLKAICTRILTFSLSYIICEHFRVDQHFIIVYLPHPNACLKSGPGFPTSHLVSLHLVRSFKEWGGCSFSDIGGIDDHHYLNFLFIKSRILTFSLSYIICEHFRVDQHFIIVYLPHPTLYGIWKVENQ